MSSPQRCECGHPLTADQLEAGIANALKAHDMAAAVDILKALMAVDSKRGAAAYDALQLGIGIGRLNDR